MTTPRPSQMIYRRSKLATYQRRSSKKFYIRLILFKFCAFYGTRLGRFHVGIIHSGYPIGGLRLVYSYGHIYHCILNTCRFSRRHHSWIQRVRFFDDRHHQPDPRSATRGSHTRGPAIGNFSQRLAAAPCMETN